MAKLDCHLNRKVKANCLFKQTMDVVGLLDFGQVDQGITRY